MRRDQKAARFKTTESKRARGDARDGTRDGTRDSTRDGTRDWHPHILYGSPLAVLQPQENR